MRSPSPRSSSATAASFSSRRRSTAGCVLNQPAGHLDPGEIAGRRPAAREVLEETAHRFEPDGARRHLPLALRAAGRDVPALLLSRPASTASTSRRSSTRRSSRCTGSRATSSSRGAREHRSPAGAALRRRLPRRAAATRSRSSADGDYALSASWSACRAASTRRSRRCCSSAQGYDVVGLFMKNWEDDDDDEYCSTREDLVDAAAVADVIGIELEAVNFAAEYKDRVFAELPARVLAPAARPTPTCCATPRSSSRRSSTTRCAWARRRSPPGTTRACGDARERASSCCKAPMPAKDQSYFLHRLTQAQLARVLFPVGELKKTRGARASRARRGCPTTPRRTRPASASSASGRSASSSPATCRKAPGPIVDARGQARRRAHRASRSTPSGSARASASAARATARASRGTWPARTSRATRSIVVQGHDHPLLMKRALRRCRRDAGFGRRRPAKAVRIRAKTRYRQADAPCRLHACPEVTIRVEFPAPQWAVTPGQSVVLYDGEVCLGGGIIT